MATRSPLHDLIQTRLGRDLSTYVGTRRKRGHTWREIASDLTSVTGVKVTYESLRRWYPDEAKSA